jgi:hypothetical protein
LDEDKLEELSEEFLDEVFGSHSKMERKEYMEMVASSANWIFSASDVRKRVDKAL